MQKYKSLKTVERLKLIHQSTPDFELDTREEIDAKF